jgi:glycosyltransferase involved in cell wall biosynthesis/SAM-dependent methyltransferase
VRRVSTGGGGDEAPTVSVLVLAYNHEPYIRQALESALEQRTDFPVEIVVAEDASTDGTAGIVTALAAEHPAIRPMFRARNAGMQVNLREGWATCRGRFIALLEGDDYWTDPAKLQRQVDFLAAHPSSSLVFHRVVEVDESDRILGPPVPPEPATAFDIGRLARTNFIPTCSVVYRAGLVPELPRELEPLPMADWPLHLLHAARGDIGFLDATMGAYRRHAGGVWSSRDRRWQRQQQVQAFRTLLRADVDLPRATRARIASVTCAELRILAGEDAEAGRLPDLARHSWQGLTVAPVVPDSWRVRAGHARRLLSLAGGAGRRWVRDRTRSAAEARVTRLPPARRLRWRRAIAVLEGHANGRPLTVADAGCEDGLFTRDLARRHPGWRVVGVDIATDAVRRGADGAGAIPNVGFAVADVTRPFARGCDAVTMLEALLEIPDDAAAVRASVAALQPGGLFIGQVPAHDWRPVLPGSRRTWRREVRHGYRPEEIRRLLEDAGLTDVHVIPTSRALVTAAQEVRDRIKRRSLKVQLAAAPAMFLAAVLDQHGITAGSPRAWFVTGRRP